MRIFVLSRCAEQRAVLLGHVLTFRNIVINDCKMILGGGGGWWWAIVAMLFVTEKNIHEPGRGGDRTVSRHEMVNLHMRAAANLLTRVCVAAYLMHARACRPAVGCTPS